MRAWAILLYVLTTYLLSQLSPPSLLFLCKVRKSPHLDLPTLINVNDEVHEPPNLFDEFSSVLIISVCLLYRLY
jgi:hypothetical protein